MRMPSAQPGCDEGQTAGSGNPVVRFVAGTGASA